VNDVFRIQATARQHGIGFRLAYIEDDFTAQETEPFGQGLPARAVRLWLRQGARRLPMEARPAGVTGARLP
jgi:hypothetical protein